MLRRLPSFGVNVYSAALQNWKQDGTKPAKTAYGIQLLLGDAAEVGFGPENDMTDKQVAQNVPVPGWVEPRLPGTTTLDAVTIYVTKDEARRAQASINARVFTPGFYQVNGRSCVDFAEMVIQVAGAPSPSDTFPRYRISDIRAQQIKDNSSQAK